MIPLVPCQGYGEDLYVSLAEVEAIVPARMAEVANHRLVIKRKPLACGDNPERDKGVSVYLTVPAAPVFLTPTYRSVPSSREFYDRL